MAASINLKVTSDFAQASADLKKFNKNFTDDQRKQIEKTMEAYKDKGINTFLDRQKKLNIAIKATKGPLEASQAEFRALQREMERLIKKGIDPQAKELKPLISRYKELEKELKDNTKASKDTTRSMSLMDGVMLGAGAAALNLAQDGFRALVQYGKDATVAAADAQEVYGKFDVIFRDLTLQSNSAAEALAEDFDLAGSTARKLLGDTGDLLTGFGLTAEKALDLSDQTNRLAIDLASFSNAQGGAVAVSRALTAAYSGERESLKTYGIVINDAMVKARMLEEAQRGLTFETEQQAKISATLALATEQSKNALGDYARTSESTANVTRRLEESQKALQEEFGKVINEGLTPMKSLLADLVKGYADFLAETNALREASLKTNEAMDAVAAGVATVSQEYLAQKAVLQELQDTYFAIANTDPSSRALETLRKQISEQQRLLSFTAQQIVLDKKGVEKNNEIAKIKKDLNDAEFAAGEELEKMRQAALSADDKRLEKLQEEIGRLAILKQSAKDMGTEWDAIERLLIASITEKNEILAKTPELIADEVTAINGVMTAEDVLAQARQDEFEILIGREENRARLREEEIDGIEAVAERERELIQERISAYEQYSSAVMGIFNAIDDLQSAKSAAELARLEAQGASEEELAQRKKEIAREEAIRGKKIALFEVAINTASAIVASFPNLALMALAAVTGGIQAAAINAQPIPTAQTGTASPIIVPDTGRHDNVAVMAGAGEQVSVTPRGEAGMTQNISVSLNDQVLIDFVNVNIESGDIRITTDNIQGGIAV